MSSHLINVLSTRDGDNKTRLLAFCLALSLIVSHQLFAQGNAAKNDLDQLQGEWNLVFSGGRDIVPGNTKWTFKGNQFTVEDTTNKLPFAPIKFALAPTANPRTIDITSADGMQRLGIYKMEDDTLTIARGMVAGYRPKEFKFQAGLQTLTVLKRATK